MGEITLKYLVRLEPGMLTRLGFTVCALLLAVTHGIAAEPRVLYLSGKVTRVVDGNNFRLVDATQAEHQVRLVDVDCPELTQPYGREAANALRMAILDRQVLVRHSEFDMRGRVLGTVLLGDTSVNLDLVKQGLAWCYPPGEKADEVYRRAEQEARTGRSGLWASDKPVPPWHWRQGVRTYRPGLENEPGRGEFPRSASSNERAIIGYPGGQVYPRR